MKSSEIRQRFIQFFSEQNHAEIPSASIIPQEDPTSLFITAGMQPLVPYLMGEPHPEGSRLVNVQKCIRTQDIEEVGDETHDTFFEMMGNWSLGDYFKEEAIKWSYQLLTDPKKGYGLDPARLYVTVFAGDDDAPRDEEAAEIWKSIGVPENRIYYLGKEDNWWGPVGDSGPCGPDTEMFYDVTGEMGDLSHDDFIQATDDKKIVEIWNDVFMQYYKEADGSFRPLEQKNVDTGAGLERVAMVLQGKDNIFETDLFEPIISVVNDMKTTQDVQAQRIIADHLRTAVFILGDDNKVVPSNVDQGYILRRLIRRAIRYSRKLGINQVRDLTENVARAVIENYQDVYPELKRNEVEILSELHKEETKFERTLEKGLKEFEKLISQPALKDPVRLSGEQAFTLFSTYGFPLEMTVEMAEEHNVGVDIEGYKKEVEKHRKLSAAGAEQKFAGGLADHSEESTKLHTATHLLHQALRDVLGDHVYQKGSNITPERLRFDFSHPEKMTPEQIKKVEDLVNEQIKKDLPVNYSEMDIEEARKEGAIGVFDERYGNRVKVYEVGDFSKEICGGPHVEHTGQLGSFKIKKEEACSAGVRRIKAVVG